MKRHFFVFCALAFFSVGCVSAKPPYRGVEGNTYRSESPEMTVSVHSAFNRTEIAENAYDREYATGPGSFTQTDELYQFLNIDDNRVKSGVVIESNEMSKGFWFPNVLGPPNGAFENEIVTIDGVNYYYKCELAKIGWIFDKSTVKKLRNENIITPDFFLVHVIGKRFGSEGRVRFFISYFEDINLQGTNYTYDDWKDKSRLTVEQQRQLKGLIEKALNSYEVAHRFDGRKKAEAIGGSGEEKVDSRRTVRDRLKALKQLLDEGIITPEDYKEKRAEIVKEL